MSLPADYVERVYAGVLGKIIGVYLGRPFEQWSHERILRELGEIRYYVHERRGVPLVVSDDDISGTFTFLRALADHGGGPDLTAAQIGETWLNYIIDRRTILWWGGLGNSTEHTAYLRLREGIPAPRSGSEELNGPVVAAQIGAQIFIDGWGLIHPGDPERAADFARRAASVSHDGVAIHGAQVVAAMVALAFVERDLERLVEGALAQVPAESPLRRMAEEIRGWCAEDADWYRNLRRLQEKYGYECFGGGCHMLPNHALIHLALWHGGGDFQRSLMIVNTAGYDTDCNSGNVGCILGVRNGLAGLEAGPDWRGPVADRLLLPTAEGGRCVSDAVRETVEIVNAARGLRGLDRWAPKDGARFHFSLPGSVQGWEAETSGECAGVVQLANEAAGGALTLHYRGLAPGRVGRVATPTFLLPAQLGQGGYHLTACPTLHSGQTLRARLRAGPADPAPVQVALFLRRYQEDDTLAVVGGPEIELVPGAEQELAWVIPDTGGFPIAQIGLALHAAGPARQAGRVELDRLTWDGAPDLLFQRPARGRTWLAGWVDACDGAGLAWGDQLLSLHHNRGTGLFLQGSRDWRDYCAETRVHPRFNRACGIAVRVQGLNRYYALLLREGRLVQLVRCLGTTEVLAEAPLEYAWHAWHDLKLTVQGDHLRAEIGDRVVLEAHDPGSPLAGGAFAFLVEEGSLDTGSVRLRPVGPPGLEPGTKGL